ncbi:MAG: hypothetical protein AB7S68_34580 [Polyangiaceae bacterium]
MAGRRSLESSVLGRLGLGLGLLMVACGSARKEPEEPPPVYAALSATPGAPLTPEISEPSSSPAPSATGSGAAPQVKPLLPLEPGPSRFKLVISDGELRSQVGPTHFIYDRNGVVVRVDGQRLVPEVGLSKVIRGAIRRTSGSLWFVSGRWPGETYVSVQGANPGPPSFSAYKSGALRGASLGGLGSVEAVGAWKGHPLFVIEDQPTTDGPWIFIDVRGQPKIAVDEAERSPLLVDTTGDGALYYVGDSSSRIHRYPGDQVIDLGSDTRIRQIAAVSATDVFALVERAKRLELLRVDGHQMSQLDSRFPAITSLDAQPDGTLWAISDGEVYLKPASGNWMHARLPEGEEPSGWERVEVVDDNDVWLFGARGVLRSTGADTTPLEWLTLLGRVAPELN